VIAAKVEAVWEPVYLERDSFVERDVKHPLQVEGILRPPVADTALRMAEAAHVGVAQRLLDTLGHLRPRHALTGVHACLDPVEL
jgi:hypothetical protein